jgi:hypothetical protein
MSLYWEPTLTPSGALGFTDSEFFSYTTEVSTYRLGRASIMKEIMKKTAPELTFRKFVSKWTDFREGTDRYFEMWKKMTRPYSQYWSTIVNEFDPLPTVQPEYKRFSVSVEERGVQIPWTLRAKIFSAVDIESEIKKHVEEVVAGSLERDLLTNGFAYLDVIGLWTDTGLTIQTGRSLAPTKTFASESGFPITINQYTIPTATTFANLNMEAIRQFARKLSEFYCPSYDGKGFGRYVVIINELARDRLSTDPEFFTAMTRLQDTKFIREGYIGTYYGQEFIVDGGKWLDTIIGSLQPTLSGKAICMFLGRDAIREAIVRPEEFKTKMGDFDRFMAIGVFTYRGEQPTWFQVEGQASGGILIAQ